MCSRGVYIPTNQTAENELLNGPSFLRVNSFLDDDASKVVGKYQKVVSRYSILKVMVHLIF